jgi:hypothetical protein
VSLDHRRENQIDNIAIDRKFRRSLTDARNKRVADIASDHHLVMVHFKFKIKKAEKKFEGQNKKFGIQKLKNKEKREAFKLELKNRFKILQESSHPDTEIDIERKWREIKDIFIETSEKNIIFKNKLKNDWMSEEIWEANGKRKNLKANLNQCKTRQQKSTIQAQYSDMDRKIKKGVKRDKRRWIEEQAQRAEEAERRDDTKQLYDITRILSGRGFRKNKPIKDDKGELLVTQEQQLQGWEEYFSGIVNKDKDNKTQSTK